MCIFLLIYHTNQSSDSVQYEFRCVYIFPFIYTIIIMPIRAVIQFMYELYISFQSFCYDGNYIYMSIMQQKCLSEKLKDR